jgi:hypothetical protein
MHDNDAAYHKIKTNYKHCCWHFPAVFNTSATYSGHITIKVEIKKLYMARMWERRTTQTVWVGKREWKRPLRRPRRGWQDNTKMDLQELVWGHGLY